MPILILAVIIVILDQATKYYIQQTMFLGMSVPVINNIFHITYILNPGAAFGIMEHKTAFFVIIAILLLAGIVYIFPRIPPECTLLRLGTGLMAGGAVGNVIDRVRTGYVVDFFDFRIWPVFNIADISIVIGVAFIIYTMLFSPHMKDEKP
ncbi:MAG: signal peptidase II [Negativicutes bacterium]|nr:signal peptidase II [Negativicutes bacterium]